MQVAIGLFVLGLLQAPFRPAPTDTRRHVPATMARRQVARPNRRTLPNKDSGRQKRSRALRSTSNLNVNALVCAACNVESSSEISFADHIYGAAHVKCAGHAGFAGLLPNAAGIVVDLIDPELRAQQRAYELGEPIPAGPPLKLRANPQLHPGELVCFTCGVSCSSETSLVDHLYGNAHRKLAGHVGFAGLAPNAMGLIPTLTDPILRAEQEAWELGLPPPERRTLQQEEEEQELAAAMDPFAAAARAGTDVGYEGMLEAGAWRPPLREVSVTAEAEQRARLALDELREQAARARRPPKGKGREEQGEEEKEGRDEGVKGEARRQRRLQERGRAMPAVPELIAGGGPEAATRMSLPVYSHRAAILEALEAEVSIIEGETGSGKTTQVPQYLLEAAASAGTHVNVICTQPRRISAIGVAERVAAERGETVGEGAVGYAVRGESRQSEKATSLLFCTTGVLLRMLEEGDGGLANVTHVLVDEVHERSVDNDFLLLALRTLLLARRERTARGGGAGGGEGDAQAAPPLKVCLMSATLDAGVLSSYFSESGFDVKRVSFPGRAFPVETLHLEDALELTGHVVDRNADWCVHSAAARKRREQAAALAASKLTGREEGEDDEEGGKRRGGSSTRRSWSSATDAPGKNYGRDIGGSKFADGDTSYDAADDFDDALDFDDEFEFGDGAVQFDGSSGSIPDDDQGDEGRLLGDAALANRPASVRAALADLDPDCLNVDLVAETVLWHLSGQHRESGLEGSDGAVLVFLPGVAEIDAVRMALLQSPLMRGRAWRGGRQASGRSDEGEEDSDNDDEGSDEDGREGGEKGDRARQIDARPLPPEQSDWVLPLHGSLPPDEQRRVFLRPPPGVTKIVLATNVAETSITIDDVTFVVDTGRAKLLTYDPTSRLASLDDVLISEAAAKQRRGRAGRVRPGLCVRLFSSDRELEKHTAPEVRRVPLEQLLMRIKALSLPGKAAEIAARLPEPPDSAAVLASIDELTSLGALDEDEHLTSLGRLLAALPISPRLGKLIVYGVAFGAIDETLTIAAGLASRSPFLSPFEARDEADDSKDEFADGWQSDYLALYHAYLDFDRRPPPERFTFARQRFLGIKTLQGIGSLKRQLLEVLSTARLAPFGLRAGRVERDSRRLNDPSDGVALALELAAEREAQRTMERAMGRGGGGGKDEEGFRGGGRGRGGRGRRGGKGMNAPMQRPSSPPPRPPSHLLLTGLLYAALHPQLAYLHAPPTKKGKPAPPSTIRLHMRDSAGMADAPTEGVVHPSSVNSRLTGAEWHSPYVAFHDACFTTRLYVRGSTPVPPLAPLLFGGRELKISECASGDAWRIVTLDGWLRIKLRAEMAPLLLELRYEIDQLLERMVERAVGGATTPADAEVEGGVLNSLCDSIDALLEDALVEPLPPKPKPARLRSGGGGSKKTRKRKASRRRKARRGARD